MAILHSQGAPQGVPGVSASMFNTAGDYKKPEWTSAVSEVERKYELVKRLQVLYEKTWYLNIAFYLGRQYVDWSNLKAGLYEPKAPSWRVRLPCNRILGPIQSQVSKLVAMRPSFATMPNTSEEEDRLAARLSEKVLEFLFEKLRLRRKLSELLLWVSTCGTGFVKVTWNDDSGEPIKIPRTENVQIPATYDDGAPVIGDDGLPAMVSSLDTMRDEQGNELFDVHHQGEVNVEIVSPFDIYPDPGSIGLDEARWLIHTRWMSIDEIRSRYRDGEKVHPERDAGLYGSYARRLRFDFLTGFASSTVPTDIENRALVKEYWERPTKEHRKGRLLVVANGVELHDGPLPYKSIYNPLPFVKFDDIRAPGRFWSQSKVEQLRPLQMSYNRRRCLSEDTECLTRRGWKRHADLSAGEDILSVDPATQASAWAPLRAVNVYDYDGEMFAQETNQISWLATPNHRWLVLNKHDHRWEVAHSWRLGSAHRIPLLAPHDGPDDHPEFGDELIELCGWVAAEGTYQREQAGKTPAVSVSQSRRRNPEKCDRILALVRACGRPEVVPYEQADGCEHYYLGADLSRQVRAIMPDKVPPPEWIASLSVRQLGLLWEGMMMGDGRRLKNPLSRFQIEFYTTTNPALADAAQMITALLGLSARMFRRPRPPNKDEFRIYVKHGKWTRADPSSLRVETYRGRVWCPTVDSGFFLARRNGRYFVTGNSQLVEAANLMSKPKWLVAKGSGIIDSGITSEPGEIIEYDASAGPKPEPVKGPEVPQYILQLIDQDVADMMEISGIHEISRGETPPGVESGRAVLALQAADESRHGDLAISYEEGLVDVARLVLERVSEFYVEPRLLKVSGKDNSYEVTSFRGADLRDNMDVRVQIGSALPQNKAYRQQTLLQWLQLQVITPQDFLRLMEFGKYERMWEDSDQDRNWARQENEQMAQGVQLNPEMHEDHAIHMEEHVRFMKSEVWRMLPEQGKQLFRMHLQITQQMMAPAPTAQGQASPSEAQSPGVAGAGPMNSPEFTGSENAQPPGVDLRQETGMGTMMGMGGM